MTRANLEHAEQLLTGELIWHKLNPKQGWSESQVLFDNFKPTKKRSRSPNESQNERQSGQQTRVPANPSSTQSSHRSYSSQLVQPSRRTKRSGNVTTTIEQRPTVEIVYGDCFQELDDLEDESIDCVITDPPPPSHGMGKKHFDKGQQIFIGRFFNPLSKCACWSADRFLAAVPNAKVCA